MVSCGMFTPQFLFVVDRKDLDYQTMKEYDRFEKGAANSIWRGIRALQVQSKPSAVVSGHDLNETNGDLRRNRLYTNGDLCENRLCMNGDLREK